jgi:intron-binding protein aquarius
LGDHNQLPPVVKNQSLRRFSHFDQSLFSRLIRLGAPFVELDQQGRSRASLADLFNWRYQNLGNLPVVISKPEFTKANTGFRYEYQVINVEDYNGRGESEPIPHFYQNLGEAEYVVSVFQYMRLLGYPAEKISIITSYNGQKNLIRDVVKQRCAANPFFGEPHKITTVDRFQGQQNDCTCNKYFYNF